MITQNNKRNTNDGNGGDYCLYSDNNPSDNYDRDAPVGIIILYRVVIRIGEKVIKAINRFIKIPAL